MNLLLLIVSVVTADDAAETYRQFALKLDPGISTGHVRAHGFLEMNVRGRIRWYLEVLANSKTARSQAKLTSKQCEAAAQFAKSIKGVGPGDIESPTALNAEALRFLQSEQRQWLVSLMMWTEGLLALRHPVVCDALGVDGEHRDKVWKRVQRDGKLASAHWATMFGSGFFMSSKADAEKAGAALFDMTFAFEKELWAKDLSESERRALQEFPVFAPEVASQIAKEVAFTALMAIGEQVAADPPKPTAASWTPKDKEMVVLLGSAFIEQEARDGYLETELIRLFPNKDIRVRNLGWSGDTVRCQARSYFGPPEEGFERLRGHLQMIKPTTVICCYGANESWKGEAGIADFRKGYDRLIDMIRAATGATVVLMTPPRFMYLQSSYPNELWPNERLARYWREIEYNSKVKGAILAKLEYEPKGELIKQPGGMDNPLDFLYPSGRYADLRGDFRVALFGEQSWPRPFIATIDWQTKKAEPAEAIQSFELKGDRMEFTAKSPILDLATGFKVRGELNQRFHFVKPRIGTYFSRVGNDASFGTRNGPDQEQLEQLRHAIIKKNALFFHRWRPANETYLYGFRKHEQGNNGVEPPQFEKLAEQAEAEIARLKKPMAHRYELGRIARDD